MNKSFSNIDIIKKNSMVHIKAGDIINLKDYGLRKQDVVIVPLIQDLILNNEVDTVHNIRVEEEWLDDYRVKILLIGKHKKTIVIGSEYDRLNLPSDAEYPETSQGIWVYDPWKSIYTMPIKISNGYIVKTGIQYRNIRMVRLTLEGLYTNTEYYRGNREYNLQILQMAYLSVNNKRVYDLAHVNVFKYGSKLYEWYSSSLIDIKINEQSDNFHITLTQGVVKGGNKYPNGLYEGGIANINLYSKNINFYFEYETFFNDTTFNVVIGEV